MAQEQEAPATVCPRCGATGPHTEGPGSGTHRARLLCGACGVFLRWLPTHPPEVQTARRQQYQQAWLAQQPATPRQLAYLAVLGYQGALPANRLEASTAIDHLKRQREERP